MLPKGNAAHPSNDLAIVRLLAAEESACEYYAAPLAELRRFNLDSDDLRQIICDDLGDCHCTGSKPTEKKHPNTMSDYYSIWVDECCSYMFLKLLIATNANGSLRLVITSFKRDEKR